MDAVSSPLKGNTHPLRLGLLVDTWIQPRWVYEIVQTIQSSSFAQVALIIKNAAHSEKPRSFVQKIFQDRDYLLYWLYRKIDDFRNRTPGDAFQPVSIEPLVSSYPVLSIRPTKKSYREYFEEEDVAKILEYDLDVSLRFGFGILMGGALQIARYGVWSYHHGDNRTHRGGPAGFWEVLEGCPTTGSVLQILTPELDNGKILYRSYAATDPFSVRKNRNHLYWKSSGFVMRKLKDLAVRGSTALDREPLPSGESPYRGRLYKVPRNSEMFGLLLKWLARYGGYKAHQFFFQEQWFVAFGMASTPKDFHSFKPLIPPPDRFWADPFVVKKEGKYFIFIEEYLEEKKKGHIAVIEVDPSGNYKKPTQVLERDYHLAYPFVFEWQGDTYMIPETSSHQTLELYRCLRFPLEWQLEKVLMEDVNAVDATLIEKEGLWWMFVNMTLHREVKNWDELYLYHAPSPLGPWTPHSQNPVKSDVRNSRPAGRIFSQNGNFYRPAQDCSKRYGHAISINQILRISPTEYMEKEVSKVLPQWRKNLIANHTLNHVDDGFTVIDGLIQRRRY